MQTIGSGYCIIQPPLHVTCNTAGELLSTSWGFMRRECGSVGRHFSAKPLVEVITMI